jgi:hypothetical protein
VLACASSATAITLPQYRTTVHHQFGWTNRANDNNCRDRITWDEFTKNPLRIVLPWMRPVHVVRVKAKHHRAQAKPSLCEYALAHAWATSPDAECVTNGEGGVSTNTGNGYYGKWQADTNFAKTYHPKAARKWGPYAYYHGGAWPERDQDLMAWRGWKARGWYPWPTTGRNCGLI